MRNRVAIVVALAPLLVVSCERRFEDHAAEKPKPGARAAKVLHFYASPGFVSKGQAFTVCYGVENTVSVRISPGVEPLKPHYNHCFQTSIQKTTTFELTARGEDQRDVSNSITVAVVAADAKPLSKGTTSPPKPVILYFVASAKEVSAGQPVTICYSIGNAKSARIEPDIGAVQTAGKKCIAVAPKSSTVYTLLVEGTDGYEHRERLEVKVN